VVARINFDVLLPIQVQIAERFIEEVTNRMRFAGSDYVIRSFRLLQNAPDRFNVVAGVTPIPPRVKVPQEQFILNTDFNTCCSLGYLSAHKCLAAAWRLMIEQDAVGGKQVVTFSIIYRHPVRIYFCRGIRASWLERGGFVLRRRRASEHFA